MNAVLRPLFSRRTIRKFTDQPVTEGMVRDLLEAAMAAPSAVAKDPWHFIVLRSRATIDQLHACLPNGKMLAGADSMAGETSTQRDGAIMLMGALSDYASYFADPGFTPIEH